jgi:predicted PurR-regulated permease PerM
MAAVVPERAPAGTEIARWSAKVLLVTAVVLLIGGAIWYARSATVPLIVATLIGAVLLPLIDWATGRGVRRGVAVSAGMIGVLLIAVGLAWVFLDALLGIIGAFLAVPMVAVGWAAYNALEQADAPRAPEPAAAGP